VAAGGVPVGTWTRRAVSAVRQRRATRRSLAPGAGLDQLNESSNALATTAPTGNAFSRSP
jgi:hypothetical protein